MTAPASGRALKVFLSSTAQDLVAYRRVADDTILRLSQEAVVMERFGPLPGEPALARRALGLRKRIEHPGVAETEQWLARVP